MDVSISAEGPGLLTEPSEPIQLYLLSCSNPDKGAGTAVFGRRGYSSPRLFEVNMTFTQWEELGAPTSLTVMFLPED